jgi:hypothetical protein
MEIPGTIFPHHYIHNRLLENRYSFLIKKDEMNRKYLEVFDKQTSSTTKILSIHVTIKN